MFSLINFDFIIIQLIFIFICYLLFINFLTFFILFLACFFILVSCFFLYYNNLIVFAVLLICIESQLFYIVFCLAFSWLRFDSLDISSLSISIKNINNRFFIFIFLFFLFLNINNCIYNIYEFTLFNNFFYLMCDITINVLSKQYNIKTLINLLFNNYYIYNSFEFFLINFFMLFAVMFFGSLYLFRQRSSILINYLTYKNNNDTVVQLNEFFLKRQSQVKQLDKSTVVCIFTKKNTSFLQQKYSNGLANYKFFITKVCYKN